MKDKREPVRLMCPRRESKRAKKKVKENKRKRGKEKHLAQGHDVRVPRSVRRKQSVA